MSITRAGLVARLTLPKALDALAEAAAWLDAHGRTPVIDRESATAADLGDRWPTAAREALPGQVDAVLAFGGDGTLLDVAGTIARAGAETPVLGVNLGRLGFLTEVGRGELADALSALVDGRTRIEERLLLVGRILRRDRVHLERLALNDVVVTRGALSRLIEVDVAIDDRPVCHVKADGLIVASATGSTAYNLSAGGPIVHPSVDALVLTPIAPHTLTNRPLVLPATMSVLLQPSPDTQPDVLVTFDGQYGESLAPGDAVEVGRATSVLRLLRTSPRSHYDMLREKLRWGG